MRAFEDTTIQNDMSPEYLQMAKDRLNLDYEGYAQRLDELGNNPDKPQKIKKQDAMNTRSLF